MIRYLIIGGGAAGMEAAQSLRQSSTGADITILSSDRFPPYSRPKLISFLAANEAPMALEAHDTEWYRANGLKLFVGRRIIAIDTEAHDAVDDSGQRYPWDRLLLACGGNSIVPAAAGSERPGIFVLRSLDDALKLREYAAGRKRAAVVGGGLLGLESAHALSSRGMEVTVIEAEPWLLPRQLDRAGGKLLQHLLEARGLRFILDARVGSFGGSGRNGAVDRLTLASGEELRTDMVLLSVGVRPETSLAEEAGIAANRGIVVDDRLRTSVPDVYAAGDAAEHRGVCYGLWTVAQEQGRRAGLNMAGIDTPYEGSIPSSQLKITGIDLYSSGDAEPGVGKADGDPALIVSGDAERYRKLRLAPDGRPLQAVVINDRAAIQLARRIMSGSADPEEFREK